MANASVVNRRDFLKTATAGGVALVIGFHLSPRAFADQAEDQEKKPPNPFDAWVRIAPDNKVTLILGKSEMGQGIMTALPMILAEELCVDWKQVKVQQAPTNPKIYDLGTGGSGSVAGSWLPPCAGQARRLAKCSSPQQPRNGKSVRTRARPRTGKWFTAIPSGICLTVNWSKPLQSFRFPTPTPFRSRTPTISL